MKIKNKITLFLSGCAFLALSACTSTSPLTPREERRLLSAHLPNATAGDAFSQTLASVIYWDGPPECRSRAAALTWARKAARQGDADGQFLLALLLLEGEDGRWAPSEETGREAAKWLELAVRKGDLASGRFPGAGEALLGAMYEGGLGVKADTDKAIVFYSKASWHGNAETGALARKELRRLLAQPEVAPPPGPEGTAKH